MIKQKIIDLLKNIIKDDIEIQVEIPREKNFGDYSSSSSFVLAKKLKQNPIQIADEIVSKIEKQKPEFIKNTENKNGFINFYLSPKWLHKQLLQILENQEDYGSNNLGKNRKVQVEFISANPTGPLTMGNSRGGIIGDTLANLLKKSNWQVTREYYFNDAGGQINDLGHSVLKDEKAVYRGDYIDQLHQKNKEKDFRKAGQWAAQEIIKKIKNTTLNMGIKFNVWFAEGKDLRDQGKAEEVIDWLVGKNLAYKKDGAVWFKATQFGDDKDRVMVKKNGDPTYFGVDCAYHKNKFITRKFDKVIDIWGADHHGDMARVKGFVKALGRDNDFEIILHQFVRLILDNKEVRMSKRKGNYVLVDDLLKEVSRDVFRFFMLQYSANSHLDFDLKKAKERSEKNPVFYIQYATARINSILNKFKIQNPKSKKISKSKIQNLKLLKHSTELDTIKQLIKFPDLVKEISQDYQVQRLPVYAIETADKFHNFYEKHRVISKNKQKTQARILLIMACQIVLKNCLNLMGISAPEKM